MTIKNRIAKYYPETVPAPRYRPPEPRSKWRWGFVLGLASGLVLAWFYGGGR